MGRDLTNTMGYIYKITSPNGKIYIGQTINVEQRKRHYKTSNFKQQIKLWNSVQKYNWIPADTYEIIDSILIGENKSNLNEREKFWIKFYDSFNHGLNCNWGGEGNIGHKHSEDTLLKMSESKKGVKHTELRNKQKSEYTKGRKHSAETKAKISKIKLDRMNNETKNKISIGLKNNKNGVGNKGNSKKVICLNTGVIYDSILKAAHDLNLHSSGIIQVCKGFYKKTKGYQFIYLDC